ncbi:MAG: CRISPR-associated endoribonuclease Cas6 [Zhaonellaceae bacterium]|jgi:CRISPR-associated endoribonuclease Cas6|nr:CRISPR-associated endoribonuclease Cas6 [Clostridia bacterium]
MKLTIEFRADNNIVLPIHYNHIVQAFVYNAISEELSQFLHDKGYECGNRTFKLFTFSRLFGKYKFSADKSTISFEDTCKLVISSPVEEFCQSLANGVLTKGYFLLGSNKVEVKGITVDKKKVEDEKVIFKTLSPVVVKKTLLKPEGGKYTCYLQPGEPEYDTLISSNLAKKYFALTAQKPPIGDLAVKSIGRLRLNLVNYKGFIIKGYSGKLELTGPRELLQMALDAGLGSSNSQGFGCVDMI